MVSTIILLLIAFFRNGRVLALIYSAAVFFSLMCFSGIENKSKKNLNKLNQENTVLVDSASCQNLTFIQPFTSLAGFNWKFGKETKRKEKDVKVISLPKIYLPNLFRK